MSDFATAAGLLWRAWRYRLRLDPAEIRYILRHVSSGQCVVDVGAHKGGYTYWLRRSVGKNGRVFAFEPQQALATALSMTFKTSRNVTVENMALSDQPGEAVLTLPLGSSTCGATLEHREQKRAIFTVRTTSLDQYFQRIPDLRVSFVKCDVEGHEASVFRGAERILRSHRPVLMFECEARLHQGDSIDSVFRYLEVLGYEGWFFWHGRQTALSEFRPEMQASPDSKPYINNFLFTPRA